MKGELIDDIMSGRVRFAYIMMLSRREWMPTVSKQIVYKAMLDKPDIDTSELVMDAVMGRDDKWDRVRI